MVTVQFCDTIPQRRLDFAVILTRYEGKWVLCRHAGRDTWEVPGGHWEEGESIVATARRELWEETGAVDYDLRPLGAYWVQGESEFVHCPEPVWGALFLAEVRSFDPLPPLEIEEIGFFDTLPEKLTYPDIQPHLLAQAQRMEDRAPRYPIVLLDADGTLLDFEDAETQALRRTFQDHGLTLTEELDARYQCINKGLWAEFEQGLIDKQTLLDSRFTRLFAEFGIQEDGVAFNREYLYNLGYGSKLLPQALELCQTLSPFCRLYILTNGVSDTQRRRLEASGLMPYLSGRFVSEDAGYQKPLPGFFDYTFARIPDFDPNQAVMVGDSLTSDMQGAANAGIPGCWFAPGGQTDTRGVLVRWRITQLLDLVPLVWGL